MIVVHRSSKMTYRYAYTMLVSDRHHQQQPAHVSNLKAEDHLSTNGPTTHFSQPSQKNQVVANAVAAGFYLVCTLTSVVITEKFPHTTAVGSIFVDVVALKSMLC